MTDPLTEAVARIIDPSSWAVMDSYLADMLRKYKGENAAYDPEQYKHKESMDVAQAAIAAMREHMLPAGWQRRMRWPLASDPPGKTYPWEQCGHDEATSHFDRRAGCEYRAIYTFPAAPTEGEG